MPRQLILANALFSLRGRVAISDGAQQPRFEARGEFALFSPTWRLYQGDVLVGSLRRKLLSLVDAQQVQVHADDDANEQFVAMAMLAVQLARQVERRRSQ
ncbi:hypothetical protein [Stenotrophomonas ginsengisoli]|nr:hypothetical protein [Stenotrophomonas ginsengisoli]